LNRAEDVVWIIDERYEHDNVEMHGHNIDRSGDFPVGNLNGVSESFALSQSKSQSPPHFSHAFFIVL
jgi:hypothetical protein